jgi:hypothetical protein
MTITKINLAVCNVNSIGYAVVFGACCVTGQFQWAFVAFLCWLASTHQAIKIHLEES